MAELTKDELLEALFIAKTGNSIAGRIAYGFAKQGITDDSWIPVEQRPGYVAPDRSKEVVGDPGPIMHSWLGVIVFWAPVFALCAMFIGAFFTGDNTKLVYCGIAGYMATLLYRVRQLREMARSE